MSNNFYTLINEAIADIEAHGYDSQSRIDRWMERIELAAREAMLPESSVRNALANTLTGIWRRQVERGIVLKNHPGISRYSLEHIKPTLRADLDRRIMASAQLIKLNRQQSIAKTLQRFSGWATSIPAGGSKAVDKPEVRDDQKKALRSIRDISLWPRSTISWRSKAARLPGNGTVIFASPATTPDPITRNGTAVCTSFAATGPARKGS